MPEEAAFAAAETLTAPDSPLGPADVKVSGFYRDLWTAKVMRGDHAPDFALARFDCHAGRCEATGEVVRLSAYRGQRPVALIFGSYT